MKIDGTRAINAADLAAIEAYFSCRIPAVIRKFLNRYNGEIVDPEDGLLIYSINKTGRSLKDWFTTIFRTEAIVQRLQYSANIQHMIDQHKWNDDVFRMGELIPIMSTLSDTNLYVAVCGEHVGKLFVIDNGEHGLSKVNMTLPELARMLDA